MTPQLHIAGIKTISQSQLDGYFMDLICMISKIGHGIKDAEQLKGCNAWKCGGSTWLGWRMARTCKKHKGNEMDKQG